MSKIVSGIGRAIGSVVEGVGNVVKGVIKSPIFKVIGTAAMVYFGGAALLGAAGGATAGAAAGSGFLGTLGSAASGALSGAGAGISSAWQGLMGAGSALMGEGGLSGAADSLAKNFGGAYSAGSQTVTPGISLTEGTSALAGNAGSGIGSMPTTDYSLGGSAPGLKVPNYAPSIPTSGVTPSAAPQGFIDKMMANKYAIPALIQGGMQLGGGLIQGYGAQKAADRQEQLSAEARDRYNRNVGTRLYR